MHARVALLLVLLAGASRAQELVLRERATCRGHAVLLGDVARVATRLATLPVAPAPAPGEKLELSREKLVERLRAAGAPVGSLSGAARVVVEPETVELDGPCVSELAREWVATELAAPGIEVRIEPRAALPALITVAVGRERSALVARWAEESPREGQVTVEVVVELDGVAAKVLPVVFQVRRFAPGARAARPIPAGRALEAEDLEDAELELAPGAGPPPSAAAFVGLVARRPIRKGEAVTPDACSPPPVVRKGERVVVEVRVGTLTVTGEGRVKDDAAQGAPVLVLLPNKPRPVEGTVLGPGRVSVELEGR